MMNALLLQQVVIEILHIVWGRRVITKGRANKNVTECRGTRKAAHGRLQGGDNPLLPCILVPGLKGKLYRQDEIGHLRGLIHEVAEAHDKKVGLFNGFSDAAAGRNGVHGIHVIEEEEINRLFLECIE